MNKRFSIVLATVVTIAMATIIVISAVSTEQDNSRTPVVTAKDIDFALTKLYLNDSILHLRTESNIPMQTIFLEMTEMTDSRDIKNRFAMITNANGVIRFLDSQTMTFRDGYMYKIAFYYNETKIASAKSSMVTDGKAVFTPVALTVLRPNQYSLIITDQGYNDMRLHFEGQTTVPIGQYIVVDIEGIDNDINCQSEIEVNSDGEIVVNSEEKNPISAGLNNGCYKLTLRHKNTKDILCILGFQVIKEEISEDKAMFVGTNWIKNVYVTIN